LLRSLENVGWIALASPKQKAANILQRERMSGKVGAFERRPELRRAKHLSCHHRADEGEPG
jgi:hypothetical protein